MSNEPTPTEGAEADLPGVTFRYNVDVRLAKPDTNLATVAVAMHFERVRVGGRTGWSFFRCLRCRALVEEKLRDQEEHAAWHASIGDPLTVQEADGWS